MKKQQGKKNIIKTDLKQVKGITLISLVITVIILLILATVTLNVVLGEGGLIDRAQQAKDLTEQAALEEQESLNTLMDEYANMMAEDSKIPEPPEEPYIDGIIVTPPEMSEGMVPVKWDDTQDNWIKTDETDEEWYNYEEKEWANVVLVGEDGKDADGDEDVFNSDGTLNEDSNYSMLVWIPRFAYQITTQYHSNGSTGGNINITFLSKDNKTKSGEDYNSKTTYPEATIGGSMSDYVVHPAFSYGGEELSGFWVGKFEASNTNEYGDSKTNANTTNLIMQTKAGVKSWRSITISNIFKVCTELNSEGNPYGLSSNDAEIDPHLMKNTEWGAVAYLSQSRYGKGEEVWINNSSSYITGSAGSSASADIDIGTTNDYKSTQGQQASTTGNITGIYDMSGGASEYVAAYLNNGSDRLTTYGLNLINAEDKYKNVYNVGSEDLGSKNYAVAIPNSGYYGDAIWEISNSGGASTSAWYSDRSYFPTKDSPFFYRGGGIGWTTDSGIFAFSHNSYYGNARDSFGFRVVITIL